jgi:hypothetical protein
VLLRAKTLNQRLVERFKEIDEHLDSGYCLAVLGALEGTERTVENLRKLMFLYGDCFPPE